MGLSMMSPGSLGTRECLGQRVLGRWSVQGGGGVSADHPSRGPQRHAVLWGPGNGSLAVSCESFLRMAGQKGAVERWMQKTWVQVLSHTQLGDNLRQMHFASRF